MFLVINMREQIMLQRAFNKAAEYLQRFNPFAS